MHRNKPKEYEVKVFVAVKEAEYGDEEITSVLEQMEQEQAEMMDDAAEEHKELVRQPAIPDK